MSRRCWMLAITTATTAVLTFPTSAAAVTGTVNQPCYTHTPLKGSQPIVVALSGGTPGADFQVAATVPGKGVGSAGSATGTFDASGNGSAQITDVFPPDGTIDPTSGERVDLSVEDFGAGGTDVPIGSTLVTTLAISVSSKPTNPAKKRLVRISGTAFAGRHLYGFVTNRTGTRVLRRFSLGTANVCGYASTKAVVAPRSVKTGTYRLYVNGGARLNKALALGIAFQIYHSYF